jgi:hypothetical protein
MTHNVLSCPQLRCPTIPLHEFLNRKSSDSVAKPPETKHSVHASRVNEKQEDLVDLLKRSLASPRKYDLSISFLKAFSKYLLTVNTGIGATSEAALSRLLKSPIESTPDLLVFLKSYVASLEGLVSGEENLLASFNYARKEVSPDLNNSVVLDPVVRASDLREEKGFEDVDTVILMTPSEQGFTKVSGKRSVMSRPKAALSDSPVSPRNTEFQSTNSFDVLSSEDATEPSEIPAPPESSVSSARSASVKRIKTGPHKRSNSGKGTAPSARAVAAASPLLHQKTTTSERERIVVEKSSEKTAVPKIPRQSVRTRTLSETRKNTTSKEANPTKRGKLITIQQKIQEQLRHLDSNDPGVDLSVQASTFSNEQ